MNTIFFRCIKSSNNIVWLCIEKFRPGGPLAWSAEVYAVAAQMLDNSVAVVCSVGLRFPKDGFSKDETRRRPTRAAPSSCAAAWRALSSARLRPRSYPGDAERPCCGPRAAQWAPL